MLLKYGLHGIALSIIMTVVILGWAFLFVFLIAFGSLIGLIIGLALLVMFLGYVNKWVAETIWDITLQDDWKSIFLHGVLLFIALLLVGIPNLLANFLVPGLLTSIIIFIVYVPVNGYIGSRIAATFESTRAAPSNFL
jgi:hypothetical protein